MLRYLVSSLLFLVVSCAASGPSFVRVEPPTTDGVVYAYRVSHVVGIIASYVVWLDGEPLSNMEIGGYAVKVVRPGRHSVTTSAGGSANFEIKAGQTCFVRVEGMDARPRCGEEMPEELKSARNQTLRGH